MKLVAALSVFTNVSCRKKCLQHWVWMQNNNSTNLVSSRFGRSKSTHKNRLVSASKVGIKNNSMFLLCKRPWVVKANERSIHPCFGRLRDCVKLSLLAIKAPPGSPAGKNARNSRSRPDQ